MEVITDTLLPCIQGMLLLDCHVINTLCPPPFQTCFVLSSLLLAPQLSLHYSGLSIDDLQLFILPSLYSTLHHTTLHYITLHHTTLHYTTLHYTTLVASIALKCVTHCSVLLCSIPLLSYTKQHPEGIELGCNIHRSDLI